MACCKGTVATVALVSDFLLHIGGVETHLLSLLRHGSSSRVRWCVVGPTSSTFEAQATGLGAQIIPWKHTHLLDPIALGRLVCLLRAQRVDLLHIHSPRAAVSGRIAARLLRVPAIVTVHLPPYYYVQGQGPRARGKREFYRWVDRILNHAVTDCLIYVSSHVCEEALALGLAPQARSTVIENGIDLTLYAGGVAKVALRKALATSEGSKVVCYVGRLADQKGIDVLLEAIRQVRMEDQACCLWLVGDGPRRAALEAQARQLGLGESAQFLGFRGDVPDVLRASDLFVLPSRYEAMPMAILEAMAAGLPAVVTDVGENARLVEHRVTGLVVTPEDPTALAAALKELLADPARCQQMGLAARRKVEPYSDVRMVERTMDVYASVLSERHAE